MATVLNFTTIRQQALQAEVTAYNAANGTALTFDQAIQALMDSRADNDIQVYGNITVYQFTERFTSAEYGKLRAEAVNDVNVLNFLNTLKAMDLADQKIPLNAPATIQALTYMTARPAGSPILTVPRAQAIGTIT